MLDVGLEPSGQQKAPSGNLGKLVNFTYASRLPKGRSLCFWLFSESPADIRIYFWSNCYHTAKRKLERLQLSTSSLFVKIWSACSCKFKAYFWTFWALYHLLFDLETIGVNEIIIWWLILEKKPPQKSREI